MALNDTFRVTANFQSGAGDIRQWVWHYTQQDAGDVTLADLVAAIIVILQAIWALLGPSVDDETEGVTLDLAVRDPATGLFDTVANGDISTLVGSAANSSMAANVSPYCTMFTAKARSRGKKKMFDVDRSLVTDSIVAGALVANLLLAAAEWNNILTVDSIRFRPGNYNYLSDTFTIWNPTPVGAGLIAGSEYQRLPGRGA